MYECKNQLNAQSEELDMMLSCYKETQLLTNSRLSTTRSDKPLTIVRANEICFKHAQWRLTEADGQIGIADLVLSNFLYTKNSKSDDSVEHLLELGYLRMTNLLPNEIYKEILCPSEIQHGMPIEYKVSILQFCSYFRFSILTEHNSKTVQESGLRFTLIDSSKLFSPIC